MAEATTTQAVDTKTTKDVDNVAGPETMAMPDSPPARDRRMSKEWDASKVLPSQFQKRKGSIYSTPGSRDGHVKGSDRDKAYWDKLKEKGWATTGK